MICNMCCAGAEAKLGSLGPSNVKVQAMSKHFYLSELWKWQNHKNQMRKVWNSHILRENFRAMGPAMKLANLAQTEKCLGAGMCILGPMQHKSSFSVTAMIAKLQLVSSHTTVSTATCCQATVRNRGSTAKSRTFQPAKEHKSKNTDCPKLSTKHKRFRCIWVHLED